MAVINQYKMYGVTSTAAEGPIKFFGTDPTTSVQLPLINETYIVKSLHVTNKASSNTPTITITNGSTKIVDTQTLVANASVEILSLPLIVESGVALKVKMSSSDSIDIGLSYLNISQEVTV